MGLSEARPLFRDPSCLQLQAKDNIENNCHASLSGLPHLTGWNSSCSTTVLKQSNYSFMLTEVELPLITNLFSFFFFIPANPKVYIRIFAMILYKKRHCGSFQICHNQKIKTTMTMMTVKADLKRMGAGVHTALHSPLLQLAPPTPTHPHGKRTSKPQTTC